MRKSNLIPTLSIIVCLLLFVTSPSLASMWDSYLGDVAIVAWLEGQTVKVALANESNSRKSITIASQGWDQRWRPFFLERTVVVPARSVTVEAFNLISTWKGEPLAVEATAWDRRSVVEVQTQEIFKPSSYVVRSQSDVEVLVNLSFLMDEKDTMSLIVDEYYQALSSQGLSYQDQGRIQVRSVDGGFQYFPNRNRVEFISPKMVLSMRAPAPRSEVMVLGFNLYKQDETNYWNPSRSEVPGPTILVYGRNLAYRDNSHLSQPPSPSWNWQSNY